MLGTINIIAYIFPKRKPTFPRRGEGYGKKGKENKNGNTIQVHSGISRDTGARGVRLRGSSGNMPSGEENMGAAIHHDEGRPGV